MNKYASVCVHVNVDLYVNMSSAPAYYFSRCFSSPVYKVTRLLNDQCQRNGEEYNCYLNVAVV